MDTLVTHPSNATQAKAFTSPASLSFPGGAGDLTPPLGSDQANGTSQTNGSQQVDAVNGNGVAPATPAATPGAAATVAGGAGVSGIVPVLQ
jgi:transcription initiation factor TFIID TATA-box-binding protein